jgi:hypothetical protein
MLFEVLLFTSSHHIRQAQIVGCLADQLIQKCAKHTLCRLREVTALGVEEESDRHVERRRYLFTVGVSHDR